MYLQLSFLLQKTIERKKNKSTSTKKRRKVKQKVLCKHTQSRIRWIFVDFLIQPFLKNWDCIIDFSIWKCQSWFNMMWNFVWNRRKDVGRDRRAGDVPQALGVTMDVLNYFLEVVWIKYAITQYKWLKYPYTN